MSSSRIAYNNRVVEVQRSQPPTLSFASTAVGSTSSDSPQSVTIQNIGNQPLNAITPGLVVGGQDFLQVAGSGTPADCTSSFALTPGASCNLSISFTPSESLYAGYGCPSLRHGRWRCHRGGNLHR